MNIYLILYLLIIHFICLGWGSILRYDPVSVNHEEEAVFTGNAFRIGRPKDKPIQLATQGITANTNVDQDTLFLASTDQSQGFKDKFFNQLNNKGEREIYANIFEVCNKAEPELTFNITINKYIDKNKVNIEKIMTCLVYDNPKFWWIESYSISLKNTFVKHGDEYDVLTVLNVNFLTPDSLFKDYTTEDVVRMNSEITLERDMLLYQIELMGLHTKYDILKFIHDYIIRNTVYTLNDLPYIHTLYGPLVKHISICSGYSELLKYIASYFGINVIIGRSLTHEWNYAEINDKWYLVDATWDDPTVSRNVYDEEKQEYNQETYRPSKGDYTNLSHKYFLVGTDVFDDDDEGQKEHELIYSYFSSKNLVVYPEIEKTGYKHDTDMEEYVERIDEEETEGILNELVDDDNKNTESEIPQDKTNKNNKNIDENSNNNNGTTISEIYSSNNVNNNGINSLFISKTFYYYNLWILSFILYLTITLNIL